MGGELIRRLKFGESEIEVIFRKASPVTDPEARYPGLKPETIVLKKGSVHGEDALPLPCDIILERDVAIKLRDGTTVYANIFRPQTDKKIPIIMTWAPYGKGYGYITLDSFPNRMGIPRNALSNLQVWEGPDPAYWCDHGYAIVNVDPRGAFSSEGDILFWGSQDAQDGHDCIEWLAGLDWCNGKIGMTGNSWLAMSQWFISSTNPPHLAAIAPWEGQVDLYRYDLCRGGIPDSGFNAFILSHLYGNNMIEDVPAMLQKYPLMNAYWEDKRVKLEKIKTPAYIVASYTNSLHSAGTFEAYRRITSKDKWLRIHNTMEWVDYYTPQYVDDLRKFFDRYLKGENNRWEDTPKVRMSVLNPGGYDVVDRAEDEFPPKNVKYTKMYLNAEKNSFDLSLPDKTSSASYDSTDRSAQVVFTHRFERTTEISGYLKAKLWVENTESNDMDIFVTLQKLSNAGEPVMQSLNSKVFVPYSGPAGQIRASHRQLDNSLSTEECPILSHRSEELLKPGQIVAVEIALTPVSMLFKEGEYLQLKISGYKSPDLFTMLRGLPGPKLRNKGKHVIYTGGKFDSHLLVPVMK